MRHCYRLLLLSMLLATNAAPAMAQYMEDANAPGMRPDVVMPRLPDIGRPYSLRVTTGATSSAGWERSLTSKDSNLRHWTWIPVTSFKQTVIGVGGPQGANVPPRPKSCYVKPTHVPLPVVVRQVPEMPVPSAPRAMKCREVPLPVVDRGQFNLPPVRRQAVAEVSGKVRLPKSPRRYEPSAAPAIASAKTYAMSYGDISGKLRTPTYSQTSDSLSVKGRLLAR